MQKYEEAPNMITSKDLDYISDMFNWNYNAYKVSNDFKEKVEEEDSKMLFDEISKIYLSHLKSIKQILK